MNKSSYLLLLIALLLSSCQNMVAPQSPAQPTTYRPPAQATPQKESHIQFLEIAVEPRGALTLSLPKLSAEISRIGSIKRYLKSVDKNSTIELSVSPNASGKDLMKALDLCKSVGIEDVKIKRATIIKKRTQKDIEMEEVRALKHGILILHLKTDHTITHNQQVIDNQKLEQILATRKFKQVLLRAAAAPLKTQIDAINTLCRKYGINKIVLTRENLTQSN